MSRFSIIGGKKKEQSTNHEEAESEFGDYTEGVSTNAYPSAAGANGYIPQFPKPRYIRVKAHNKTIRTCPGDKTFLAQILGGSQEERRRPSSSTEPQRPPSPNKLSKPQHQHSNSIWATEFSKDGKYLAVAGQDQVIRLYTVIANMKEREQHEKEDEPLGSGSAGERLSAPVFRSKPLKELRGHTADILDLSWSKNNFLLSSSMDKTVKLWHVSRDEVLCSFIHSDFVTSISFHPLDDRFFLAGSLDQVLRLWSIPDKSVAFWSKVPELITAVAFSPDGKTSIAGTLGGQCMFYETEGLKYNTQIHVRSSRGKNAKGSKITGIKTGVLPHGDLGVKVLITSNDSRIRLYDLKDKALEMKFKGHENTCSQIRASFTEDGKYVVSGSEDSKAYIWSTAPVADSERRPYETFDAHSDMVTCVVTAPTKTRQLLNMAGDPIYELCNPPPITLMSKAESSAPSLQNPEVEKKPSDSKSEQSQKVPEETPAYAKRSTHKAGNIIVTADNAGNIKVFRQDCAFTKRNEHWETSSNFSKKMLGRTNSIRTRNSNSSRRSSLSSIHPNGNDILSWRSGVERGARPAPSERSVSPGKFGRSSTTSIANSSHSLAQIGRQQPYNSVTATSSATTSPPPSLHKSPTNPIGPPAPSFTFTSEHPSKLDSSGRSYQFWNRSFTAPVKNNDTLAPPTKGRNGSVVSKLSSEEPSGDEESEGEALSCRKCGGKDFRARKLYGKAQKLVCTKCYTVVE